MKTIRSSCVAAENTQDWELYGLVMHPGRPRRARGLRRGTGRPIREMGWIGRRWEEREERQRQRVGGAAGEAVSDEVGLEN
jgi:hypothetical protein